TTEDAIRAEDWQEWHDVYVADKYALDIQQRFTDADNVYAYQNMLARMLEVSRKDYWNPDEETVNSLISAYLETVEETGLSCSDQVCGNEKLLNYLQQHAQGDQKQAVQTLHRQLGRIGHQAPTTNRGQPNPQRATNNEPASAANTESSSQPPSKEGTTSQELTGYKMEEDVWFQANEIHREHENLYWETALLLLALFGLGFMVAGRPK
ncbi:MAG: cobaltochelatase subunit CobN, partial [Sphingobacterium sp.]